MNADDRDDINRIYSEIARKETGGHRRIFISLIKPSLTVFRGLRMFFGGRERQIYGSIERYVSLVLEAVREVQKLYDIVDTNDISGVDLVYSEIDRKETEADELRRMLSEEISQGSFFSHLREDLLNLLEEIDNIADSAKDAVKTLIEAEVSWELLRYLFSQPEMREYINICVEITVKLAEAIKVLKLSGLKAIPILREIEDLEEKADEVKSILTRKVLSQAGKFDLLSILQVKEMLYLLDNLCDSAEDSSDKILLIIAKGYS